MELTLDQALQKGVEAHKAGKALDADRYYTAILKADPKHPDANHNMGVLAVDVGKVTEALPFFKTALEANPKIAQFWLSYIDALIKLDKINEARTLFERAKSNGIAGNKLKRLEQELRNRQSSSEHEPKNIDPSQDQLQLLLKLYSQKKLEEALAQAKKLVEQFPNSAIPHNFCGAIYFGLAQDDAALKSYKKAVSIKPDYAEAFYNMGRILMESDPNSAVDCFDSAIKYKPNYADAYNNMGVVLLIVGNLEGAYENFSKALEMSPKNIEVKQNISELLKDFTPNNPSNVAITRMNEKIRSESKILSFENSNITIVKELKKFLTEIYMLEPALGTSLSQRYRRNSTDLNCERHKKVFNEEKIIPNFCFGCYKVQIEVFSLLDLIRLSSFFYNAEFEQNLTRKCLIELRSNIKGFYKGLVYCRGKDEAYNTKIIITDNLPKFDNDVSVKVKRGCSEFPLLYPKYQDLGGTDEEPFDYPDDWREIETKFDKNHSSTFKKIVNPSLKTFCLSDFLIIRKWIDYAKGLGDPSADYFTDFEIRYDSIYTFAKTRKGDFLALYQNGH